MGARGKLNVAYFNGSLLAAAAVGLAAQSWPAFLIALALLLGANLYLGQIRPTRPRR